jgi:hypothetical protein
LRLTASIFVGLLAFAPFPSEALPSVAGAPSQGDSNVIDVAVNCGPHAHYIRGHRDAHHQYVKGRCVRDHRH